MTEPRYAPISDYALIGDCHGSALVRRDGSIDWLCLTRFDSGGVFCRMLDAERGGAFRIVAHDLIETRRRYLPDTNVLETTLVTRTGVPSTSWRSPSLISRSAALLPQYTAPPGYASSPAVDPRLTTWPRPRTTIPGTTARVT